MGGFSGEWGAGGGGRGADLESLGFRVWFRV